MAQAGEVFKVVCNMSLLSGAVRLVNRYHFRLISPSFVSDASVSSDLCSLVDGMYGQLVNALPASMSFDTIQIYCVDDQRILGQFSWPNLVSGNVTNADIVATATSLLAVLRTTTPGVRGRVYLGGFVEPLLEGSRWTNALLSATTTALSVLLTTQEINAHQYRYVIHRSATNTWVTPYELALSAVPALQRRRTEGRGA